MPCFSSVTWAQTEILRPHMLEKLMLGLSCHDALSPSGQLCTAFPSSPVVSFGQQISLLSPATNVCALIREVLFKKGCLY